MGSEKNKPAIIAAWNGVNFYKESGDDRADYPFEKYAKDAGACGVGYCYNFFPPFARAIPQNSAQPLIYSPKIAWGISAFLMGYAYKDAGGVLHFHLADAGYKSVAEMFKEYAAAARRVRNEFSTVGVNPNVWGNMAKIVAKNKKWQERHGEEEAAALERTRHADHGAARELWAAVEPIADKYVAWVKGGCTVDDNFLPVVAEVAADEAAPVPVVTETQKRGGKPFSVCVVDGTRAAEVTAKLHDLMGAKRGKDACLIVAGAVAAGVIRRPTYEQFREEFGKLAGKSYYNSCQSSFFSDEELAAVVKVFS